MHVRSHSAGFHHLNPKQIRSLLLSSCLAVSLFQLSGRLQNLVTGAQHANPNPGTGPAGRLYVPDPFCSQVLHWAHSRKQTCHPGIIQTAFLVANHDPGFSSSSRLARTSAHPSLSLVSYLHGFCCGIASLSRKPCYSLFWMASPSRFITFPWQNYPLALKLLSH